MATTETPTDDKPEEQPHGEEDIGAPSLDEIDVGVDYLHECPRCRIVTPLKQQNIRDERVPAEPILDTDDPVAQRLEAQYRELACVRLITDVREVDELVRWEAERIMQGERIDDVMLYALLTRVQGLEQTIRWHLEPFITETEEGEKYDLLSYV